MATISSQPRIGPLLREWRKRRRRTQLEVALDAGVSARHLSFVETGRSKPSPEMVLLLAEQLEVPVRERNQLLLAAGHAPAIPEHSITDPELAPVREALDLILTGHDPYPAVVVDRGWNLVAANSALARWTVNLGEVRAYFLGRLARQVAITGDPDLTALLEEVTGYPAPEHQPTGETATSHIITPLMRMRSPDGDELSFFATVATFGTATEVTTSELSIELTFPADAATDETMRNLLAKGVQ
jgi:transcriptional regulator with XRE-family HTH domain